MISKPDLTCLDPVGSVLSPFSFIIQLYHLNNLIIWLKIELYFNEVYSLSLKNDEAVNK